MTHLNSRDHDPRAGARNLLLTCARSRRGDRLLIAYEPESFGYFDLAVRQVVEREALSLGLTVTLLDVGFQPVHQQLPAALADQVAGHDIVLFLARLGDQLRFSEMPQGPRFVVCFAPNEHLLGSSFCQADYDALCQVKRAIDDAMWSARKIVLTCPAGTRVVGHVEAGTGAPRDTTVLRFPMSVFSPVPAGLFSGRVALGGFLTGTGSRYYDDYTVEFDAPVFALLDAGRLAGFEGSESDVAKANRHYDRVARQFGLDREFVHSWHAGIHPGCGYPWDLRHTYELWGGTAFGNPRVLHFHTCGAYAPGEISWNTFDPTIEVDGVRVWEEGRLCLDRLSGGGEILKSHPGLADLFARPDRDVGLMDTPGV